MSESIKYKIVGKNYFFPKKSKKIFRLVKSRKKIKIKFIVGILISISLLIFIFFLIYKHRINKSLLSFEKYKNKGKDGKDDFYNSLLQLINSDEKYNGAKSCYYNPSDSCLYKYLCPKKAVGKKLKHYGIIKDGAYILTDDLKNIKIAYSFGVNTEFSFEMNIADNDIDVYMYDLTISKLDFEKYNLGKNTNFTHDINYYNKKLHFYAIGITGSIDHNNKFKTLEELLKDNGHLKEENMILKMDIEGAEWEVLKNLSDDILKRFKYLSFELHLSQNPKRWYGDVLKKLSKYHQVIFLRCNNWGGLISFDNNRFCTCIEISYILKEGNEFVRDDTVYPIKEFNYTNRPGHDLDINLNIYEK